jgi:hypothetical protein
MTDKTRHPAPYHPKFLKEFASILGDAPNVIDVFGGIGRIADLHKHGYTGCIFANELEECWSKQIPDNVVTTIGDSAHLPYPDTTFYSACTSCTYGNRMGDHHNAKDGSKRNTYTHCKGEPLEDGNTGKMQFTGRRKSSLEYCVKHKAIWLEQLRVLKDGATFILNVKDHIRGGKRVRVTLWHRLCLQSLGYELVEHRKVEAPGNRQGANGEKRIPYESILIFRVHKGA